MTIINALIFLMCSSLIDNGIACLNTTLNWTCPGGYLKVVKALWETHQGCGYYSKYAGAFATTHLQNKCNNKTTCDVTDSSFDVACSTCTALDYDYECISKSFVLRSL